MSGTTCVQVKAILFDMDGTMVDSTAGVLGAWELFKKMYPTIDVHDILSSSHGVRTVENLRRHCNIQDPDELEREAERFEKAIVSSSSDQGRPGLKLLPGVTEIMAELGEYRSIPAGLWTICTSATNVYCRSALETTGIPIPDALVVAEDVSQGKPAPDPYLLGARKIGRKPEECIVFEDAPSGIQSGNAAGCKTVALLTTHSREQLEAANPDFIIQDLASVKAKRLSEGGLEIQLECV